MDSILGLSYIQDIFFLLLLQLKSIGFICIKMILSNYVDQ